MIIIKDKYIYLCRSRMRGQITFDEHRYDSMKSGCSSSVETFSRDAPCIKSVFNVSFTHRFMGGYLTQIWSIYVRSSPRNHFSPRRPSNDNSQILLSFGVRNALLRRLFWYISFSLLRLFLSCIQASTNINNRLRNSSLERRFRTRVTNRVHYFATYTWPTRHSIFSSDFSGILYCGILCYILPDVDLLTVRGA